MKLPLWGFCLTETDNGDDFCFYTSRQEGVDNNDCSLSPGGIKTEIIPIYFSLGHKHYKGKFRPF